MPELPEVEMVVRHLQQLITHRTIIKAQLKLPRLAPNNTPRQFTTWLKQARIDSITRRGKHILLHFDNARSLLVHLRMTGRFLYLGNEQADIKHTHARFELDNGKKLLFVDPRQFGLMYLTRTDELPHSKHLSKLAPEPFSEEFTADVLHTVLKRSKQPIKLTLLDQTKVLGLGNIYASEALHRAQINPRLLAHKLSPIRATRLHQEILAVLTEAIANNSTMNTDPENISGSYTGGVYETMTKVYERAGMPCYTCQTPIRRFVQGSRSTYYCPRCQSR
ncbi:MAG TPA: bifunctional DNA-formamidopyrimidine glycosylase/DNA-(apurinic or apyrimidinic site) lyase [Blastocatellia bacterium]|nr:bifunctional DNA-formamidopyrimidine glycosylase/DNA-(apurinic or apyrimidinic site) lyase [Blastocatellia bacterium]